MAGAGRVRLNVGCGTDYRPGWINGDIDPRVADMVLDLDAPPYPFEPDSVDEIAANEVLEHVGDLPRVMDGLHAILKVGGVLRVRVPHFSSYGAMDHYDHRRAFHYNSFAWCDLDRSPANMLHANRLRRIPERRLVFSFWPRPLARLSSALFNRHLNLYTTTALAYLFPAQYVEYSLVKPSPEEERRVAERLELGAAARWRLADED